MDVLMGDRGSFLLISSILLVKKKQDYKLRVRRCWEFEKRDV